MKVTGKVQYLNPRWWWIPHHLVQFSKRFSFSSFCILSAHFSVFCISPPVWFPLCGVPFIEIAVEVVCVWPPRAVIEPICRLAPVGLNPGLTALRWLNAFTMFLKPILFLFLAPPLRPVTTLPTALLVQNEFLIEIDALSFHWVCNPPQRVLTSCYFAAWHGRFMCWKNGSAKEVGEVSGALCVGLDWSAYRLSCMVLTLLNFHPRFTVWYVWVKSSAAILISLSLKQKIPFCYWEYHNILLNLISFSVLELL